MMDEQAPDIAELNFGLPHLCIQFDQDWVLRADRPMELVRAHCREVRVAEVSVLAQDIMRLLGSDLADRDLDRLFLASISSPLPTRHYGSCGRVLWWAVLQEVARCLAEVQVFEWWVVPPCRHPPVRSTLVEWVVSLPGRGAPCFGWEVPAGEFVAAWTRCNAICGDLAFRFLLAALESSYMSISPAALGELRRELDGLGYEESMLGNIKELSRADGW